MALRSGKDLVPLSPALHGVGFFLYSARSSFPPLTCLGAGGANVHSDIKGFPVLNGSIEGGNAAIAQTLRALGVLISLVYLRSAFLADSLFHGAFGFQGRSTS